MNRAALTALALFAFATTASAATLTVSSDQSVYGVGDAVTLTVTGSSNGTTEVANAVFAKLLFDAAGFAFVSSNQAAPCNPFFPSCDWVLGVLDEGPGFAVALNQIATLTPIPSPGGNHVGTVVLTALAPGAFDARFELATADYYGAIPGGPALFTVVPEPGTEGLLTLGILGIAGRRYPLMRRA